MTLSWCLHSSAMFVYSPWNSTLVQIRYPGQWQPITIAYIVFSNVATVRQLFVAVHVVYAVYPSAFQLTLLTPQRMTGYFYLSTGRRRPLGSASRSRSQWKWLLLLPDTRGPWMLTPPSVIFSDLGLALVADDFKSGINRINYSELQKHQQEEYWWHIARAIPNMDIHTLPPLAGFLKSKYSMNSASNRNEVKVKQSHYRRRGLWGSGRLRHQNF
jgi:hypothetical protein